MLQLSNNKNVKRANQAISLTIIISIILLTAYGMYLGGADFS